MNRARDAGLVAGVKASRGRPSISHLMIVSFLVMQQWIRR